MLRPNLARRQTRAATVSATRPNRTSRPVTSHKAQVTIRRRRHSGSPPPPAGPPPAPRRGAPGGRGGREEAPKGGGGGARFWGLGEETQGESGGFSKIFRKPRGGSSSRA